MTAPAPTTLPLGEWSVAELRAGGFDAFGIVQPLLREQGLPPRSEREATLAALQERGDVVVDASGRTLPAGRLAEVMLYRSLARRTTVVRPCWFELAPPDRMLVLSDVEGADAVMLVQEHDGQVLVTLADPRETAEELVDAALGDQVLDDRVGSRLHVLSEGEALLLQGGGALLQLEGLAAPDGPLPTDPAGPPVTQAVLTIVRVRDDVGLVVGGRTDGEVGVVVRTAGRLDLVDQVAAMLMPMRPSA